MVVVEVVVVEVVVVVVVVVVVGTMELSIQMAIPGETLRRQKIMLKNTH